MRHADRWALTTNGARPPWALGVTLAIVVALALKAALLASGSVAFTSDEAVMALMGKHIARGEIPIFYYGEAYVGSLDAMLIALAFRAMGQSVTAVRVVQIALYAGTMLTTCFLTRRIYGDPSAARMAILLMAIPPVLLSLHTTAGLGAYGETLLIGTGLLLIGHQLLTDRRDSWSLWGLFGLLAGVGFWTFGLIMAYLLPVGLLILLNLNQRPVFLRTRSPIAGKIGSPASRRLYGFPSERACPEHREWVRRRQLWARYLLGGLAFLIGSAPWWWYNLARDWAALKVLYDPQAGTAIAALPIWKRALGVIGLGLPALIGLRPSWSVEWVSLPLSPLIITFYLAVLACAARRQANTFVVATSVVSSRTVRRDTGQMLLLLFSILFIALLIGTRFGADATGRYMLPLYSALFPLCGAWLSQAKRRRPLWAVAILTLVLGFNLLGNAQAMLSEEGLTTEFWSGVRFDRRSDEALLDFLLDHGLHNGYSNRHAHFRIDFLSDERILLLPRLSSRSGLCINLDGRGDRYPAYTARVESSPVMFYLTTEQPYLDALLRDRLAALDITYQEKEIGPYRVFYDLSHPVRPQDMCAFEDGL